MWTLRLQVACARSTPSSPWAYKSETPEFIASQFFKNMKPGKGVSHGLITRKGCIQHHCRGLVKHFQPRDMSAQKTKITPLHQKQNLGVKWREEWKGRGAPVVSKQNLYRYFHRYSLVSNGMDVTIISACTPLAHKSTQAPKAPRNSMTDNWPQNQRPFVLGFPPGLLKCNYVSLLLKKIDWLSESRGLYFGKDPIQFENLKVRRQWRRESSRKSPSASRTNFLF